MGTFRTYPPLKILKKLSTDNVPKSNHIFLIKNSIHSFNIFIKLYYFSHFVC